MAAAAVPVAAVHAVAASARHGPPVRDAARIGVLVAGGRLRAGRIGLGCTGAGFGLAHARFGFALRRPVGSVDEALLDGGLALRRRDPAALVEDEALGAVAVFLAHPDAALK